MPKHDFGIMPDFPGYRRYDAYEPQKYRCVFVDDMDLEPLLPEISEIPCYWHTLAVAGKGLAYCGITLIPPKSAALFAKIFKQQDEARFATVTALFARAAKTRKYVIHFGI